MHHHMRLDGLIVESKIDARSYNSIKEKLVVKSKVIREEKSEFRSKF